MSANQNCPKCHGTGVEATVVHGVWPNGEACEEPVKCGSCDGFGRSPLTAACDDCAGKGTYSDGLPCDECHGSGFSARPTRAALDVLAERHRQVSVEGWTPEHDDEHDGGQLSAAAAAYASEASDRMGAMMPRAANDIPPHGWPWDEAWWKPKDVRSDLMRAAALLLAEIERLDRAAAPYCAKLAGPCPDGCPSVKLTGCGGGTAGDCWRVKAP